jgi:hypothetical protein
MHFIFLSSPSSHPDNEEKKIPQQHLHENPKCGADDKQKTASEIGHFYKRRHGHF